jgi:hypothetical protein
MIARLWHGVVSSEKADAYGQYLAGFGVETMNRKDWRQYSDWLMRT